MAIHLYADAAAILRLHPLTQALEYVAWRGFRFDSPPRAHLYVGTGYAGRVALERPPVWVPQAGAINPSRPLPFQEENFAAY